MDKGKDKTEGHCLNCRNIALQETAAVHNGSCVRTEADGATIHTL